MHKTAIALLCCGLLASAADVSGIWLGTSAVGRHGQVQDFAFHFVQKGTALTGKVYLDYASTPILKGVVEGEKLSFEIVAREQNGNEINESLLRFTGVWKDGAIELSRERQEIRNAGNSGVGFNRPGPPMVIKITRMP